jgi:glycosyltransferase involved in cell wall biosynthesis
VNLVIVNEFFPPEILDGPGVTSDLIREALSARGHRVSVVTASLGTAGPRAGVHRILTPYFDPKRPARPLGVARKTAIDVRTHRAARAFFRRVQPDVVFVYNVRYVSFRVVTAALALGIPVVMFTPDDFVAALCARCRAAGLAGRLRAALVYRGFRFARIVSPGRHMARVYEAAGFSPAAITVLPHGVDADRFQPRGAPAPGALACIGRVHLVKGQHVAVAALARLHALGHGHATLRLVGAGDDDYVARIEADVRRLGLGAVVHLAGAIPHERIPAVFDEAAIVVMPSLSETFPHVALEAMASGRPLVASRVGGLPEIVTDGVDGLLVPAQDADALAAAVDRLLRDREFAARLGARARQTVLDRFSQDRFMSALEEILAGAARRSRL